MSEVYQPLLEQVLTPAVALGVLGSGVLLLVGLLTGVWKYCAIMASEKSRAPYYVDIAHRASLMYSFSALVLAVLAACSVWSNVLNVIAIAANLIYFSAAILTYIIHGILRDTSNQLAKPHRLGRLTLPHLLLAAFMWSLIIAEVGGTLTLLSGAAIRLWPTLINL